MDEMAEFITLWDLVQDVQFNEEEDQIKWKWTENETAFHLCLNCCYAKEVWVLVTNWTGGVICMPASYEDALETWWSRSLQPFSNKQRR
ncbi:hypothetical protein SETIT_7G139000v2 [Setaria italica]|uniref:Uncharacterized protein n=1 Tax=Setaria italica TaxID=4555 RepID=A0A368RVB9_SETIT|nr:hypothetical protein SETIT_7G139000v2 [Setaria italica]